jgi:arsenate reductase
MARVLFVCLHNAGRSQMSRAFFDRDAAGRHESDSAGTTPGERDEIARRVGALLDELDTLA